MLGILSGAATLALANASATATSFSLSQTSASSTSVAAWERYLDQAYNGNDESSVNELCSEYLVSFLEGTTDAKDTCEGIQNAYVAANCGEISTDWAKSLDDDQDDYFGNFYEHKCCQSLLARHAEYCEEHKVLSNLHLLLVSSVLLLCEVAKSVVKKRDLHFLPEAAVCILVGIVFGALAHLVPGVDIDDISFDGELFLTVLLPPIIFEAALSVSKRDFRRRRLAIFMFAVFGTILSSFLTGFMVHYASKLLKQELPLLDSLVFGALISSIDPVAILSVLTSLHLNQTDTVYILVFGESLLNDAIAITMSETLIARFYSSGKLQADEVLGAIADFLIVCFGSVTVGFICALLSMVFFWLFRRMLNPGMEVGSFFLWALIPYWICDGLEWSGIVAIVTMGFFMDIYIASSKSAESPRHTSREIATSIASSPRPISPESFETYVKMMDDASSVNTRGVDDNYTCNPPPSLKRLNILDLLYKNERIRLSPEADRHVRFVAHLMAQLSENAIFAYLGLFLFSGHYDWDVALVSVSIASCILSRGFMVVFVCFLIWHVTKVRFGPNGVSRTATQLQNKGTQLVLMFAGLRGAVSLALVENVPIYNSVTEEGCEYKPLLKAMTSGAIIFTMFVFGGGAYYIFPRLGIKPDHSNTAFDSFSVAGETEMSYQEPSVLPYREHLEQQPPLATESSTQEPNVHQAHQEPNEQRPSNETGPRPEII